MCSPMECIPSSQGGEVPLWQPKAVQSVRELAGACRGRSRGSLFMEMTNRRGSLTPNRGRDHLGRTVREPWCALTVRFRDSSSLLQRLRELPKTLKGSLFCWVWMAAEPPYLWPDWPTASTCVLLVGGVPAAYSVRRVAQILLQDLSLGRRSDGHDFASDWWLRPLADEEDFEYWYSCHAYPLQCVHQAWEIHPGDGGEMYDLNLEIAESSVGAYPSPSASTRSGRDDRGCSARQSLRELDGNAVSGRPAG